jgi:hypothetical protein
MIAARWSGLKAWSVKGYGATQQIDLNHANALSAEVDRSTL